VVEDGRIQSALYSLY